MTCNQDCHTDASQHAYVEGTLVSEGPSDRRLIPILNWIANEYDTVLTVERAQFFGRRAPDLADRIRDAVELFPCDVVFVHRDTDRETPEARLREIQESLTKSRVAVDAIPVVPVKMQEAWLLFDEPAIRRASGYPKGTRNLGLPAIGRLDQIADPKQLLNETLVLASGLAGRRRRQFDVNSAAYRLAESIEDYSPLRALTAFQLLETNMKRLLETDGDAGS